MQTQQTQIPVQLYDYVPVNEVIGTYLGKTTFYNHVHKGLIKIYKLGNKSFVRQSEFFAAFQPVEIVASESLNTSQSN